MTRFYGRWEHRKIATWHCWEKHDPRIAVGCRVFLSVEDRDEGVAGFEIRAIRSGDVVIGVILQKEVSVGRFMVRIFFPRKHFVGVPVK